MNLKKKKKQSLKFRKNKKINVKGREMNKKMAKFQGKKNERE